MKLQQHISFCRQGRASLRRLVALGIALALLAGACGDDGNNADGVTPGDGTPTEAETLDPDASLRFGYLFVATTMDPHLARHIGDWPSLLPAWDLLLTVDDQHAVQPGLAETWEFDEAGTALTLNLRDGVTFHDGAPVDGEAVKASLERAKSERATPSIASALGDINEIEVLDSSTVVLRLSRPNSEILLQLAGMSGVVINPAFMDQDLTNLPEGASSGPFMVTEFRPTERAVYQRVSDGHWNGEVARVNQLVVDAYADVQAGANALETGELDVMFGQGLPVDVAEGIVDRNEQISMHLAATNGLRATIALRNTRNEFGDIRVRQAIAHAIDREAIATQAVADGCVPVLQWFPETAEGHIPDYHPFPYNPERAKELLEEAGVSALSFDILVPSEGGAQRRAAEAAQAMLAEIGVQMEITPVALVDGPARFAEGGSDSFLMSLAAPGALGLENSFFGSAALAGPEEATFRDVIAQAVAPGEGRTERMQEAGRVATDSALLIPICSQPNIWLYGQDVVGIESMPRTLTGFGDPTYLAMAES